MRYRLAIFDMDGTILNTLEDLADSVNHALKTQNLPSRNLEEIRCFVGNGIRKLIERSVPNGTDAKIENAVFEEFRTYYRKNCAVKTRPYDGILTVLKQLRAEGIKTAVVSNKADFAVQSLCQEYFDGLFDFAVGDREGQRKKPYPDSVNTVLQRFDMDKSEAVYIGDSEVDFATAKNADMDVLMVGWGFRDEAFLKNEGAESVLSEPQEILFFIKNS